MRLTAGKWILAIAAIALGGIVLGVLLGSVVDSDIKGPSSPARPSGESGAATGGSEPGLVEARPEISSPVGGYRSDFDYDAEGWTSPVPVEMSEFHGAARAESAAAAAESAAESAAEDVLAARESVPVTDSASDSAEGLTTSEVRKSELVQDGLY